MNEINIKKLKGKRVLWTGATIWADKEIRESEVLGFSPNGEFVYLEPGGWREIPFITVLDVLNE